MISTFNPPFLKQQILDSSKPKELAGDNFEFDENGIKFSKRVENTVGIGEIARNRAISRFPTVFTNDVYCRYVKTKACLG